MTQEKQRPVAEAFSRWSTVPIRLIVGYGFFAHGVAKLDRGPDHFVEIVRGIGVPLPYLMAQLTIYVELVCGLLMIAGAFVPLIALPMLAVLLVAMFTVHIQFGFTSIKLVDVTAAGPKFGPPGMEADLLYIACLATLVAAGPGPFSIDNWLSRRFNRRPA